MSKKYQTSEIRKNVAKDINNYPKLFMAYKAQQMRKTEAKLDMVKLFEALTPQNSPSKR